MKRPLDKIIDIILFLIPDNIDNKQYLKIELESIKDSYFYTPPEALHTPWLRTAQALQNYLGEPDGTTWKREVQGLMTGKIDYMDYLTEIM